MAKTFKYVQCADCDAIYLRAQAPVECAGCGAMEPVYADWNPADDDRDRDVGEVLATLVSWLEDLKEHQDHGRLYESCADALALVASALPDRDWLWMDTETDIDEEGDTDA